MFNKYWYHITEKLGSEQFLKVENGNSRNAPFKACPWIYGTYKPCTQCDTTQSITNICFRKRESKTAKTNGIIMP
jgi:hypothetical protein